MRSFVTVLVISSIVLSGCSRLRDSRLNPGNWFGGGAAEPVAAAPGQANPLIPERTRLRRSERRSIYTGTPVDQVTDVRIETTTSGAIVRVTGVSLQQGAFDVRLLADNEGDPVDGVLTLRLLAEQPRDTAQGSPRQRTVEAGRFISKNTLARTRSIRVIGARNERAARN